jgi:aspartate--ammonia ligase
MRYKIKGSYISKLSFQDTLMAKETIRNEFKANLKTKLSLFEVEPAIVTDNATWLNDDFNNSERPLDFDTNVDVFGQVVQSNAKWRRKTITELEEIKPENGILTDGLFIRRDREVSNISAVSFNEIGFDIYKKNYKLDDIKDLLTLAYAEILNTDDAVRRKFKDIDEDHFGNEITFITSTQLKVLYPLYSFSERLNNFGKNNGSFILHDFIGSTLDSKNESKYSQDVYDFKSYCELYVYNKNLEQSICIGWGAYQVNRDQLKDQTEILHEEWKGKTEYENAIKSNKLLLTISISFDFARIAMTILEKQHIAEVISSIWEQDFLEYVDKNKIKIL